MNKNTSIIKFEIKYLVFEIQTIGEKMIKLTNHKINITTVVDVLLNQRGKPIGWVIAKYLSIAIAVIVKTLAPTATPKKN